MWAIPVYHVLLLATASALPVDNDSCIQGNTCSLPVCFCANSSSNGAGLAPGGIKPGEIPQIVAFSFDDAVTAVNYPFYEQLFPESRKNPNGCPVTMSLFVSHNYTDYGLVRNLHQRGMEIGSHSVQHSSSYSVWTQMSRDDMLFESQESKRLISAGAGIPVEDIRGWRFPFLQPGGDLSFEVLQEAGYEYDSSLLTLGTTGSTQQQWPFTLDFGFIPTCVIPSCPQNSHKGFWEIPVVPISDRTGTFPCSYIDGCVNQPTSKTEALEILMKNFYANYNGRRSPLYINLRASWLTSYFKLEAMDEFIQTILGNNDVYIVSFHKMLEWVRDPTRLAEISSFKPWDCERQ
ncbi:chitin deacetylase 7-like [Liolophura sinensis]|uniref:chitin deacetylase 7-like n=1 Tax=Liolophura sinensis TaxID=3198878 RepID=UPI003159840B